MLWKRINEYKTKGINREENSQNQYETQELAYVKQSMIKPTSGLADKEKVEKRSTRNENGRSTHSQRET